MRDDDYIDERPSYFGRIDPYCWFLVVPIWIVSIGLEKSIENPEVFWRYLILF